MEELTNIQRDLLMMGKCPFCERSIRNWKAPMGSFAPEMWATLKENNIDPSNGHKLFCPHKDIILE